MIEKLKKIYPEYLIFIKKENKVFNLLGREINLKKIKRNYVLIDNLSYEVHKKIF